MPYKYEPLELYLQGLPAHIQEKKLTFYQIEQIIDASLPRSASEHRAWWGNQANTRNRPQARAWTEAGFKVETVHQVGANPWVLFTRKVRS